MRFAVCDSRNVWIKAVEKSIRSCDRFEGKETDTIPYSSVKKLIADLRTEEGFDLIFLDINMPRTDCKDACRRIKLVSDAPVVLMSDNEEPEPWIFEVDAAGYLKKPFSKRTFCNTVDVAMKTVRGKIFRCLDNGRFRQYSTDSIRYFCSSDHYLQIYTDREDALIREGLANIEDALMLAGFFRCHRSYLINLLYVRGWKGKAVILEHPNGDIKIPLSREKRQELRDAVLQRYKNIS